jgi:hypothetical protein
MVLLRPVPRSASEGIPIDGRRLAYASLRQAILDRASEPHPVESVRAFYALTRELLTKIRLFDESHEWARQNFQSCAHWLHFRVGLSLHAAQEKVRTARALKTLPQIDEKLKVGELSYSKARALSRIANTENESELLHIAEHATAAQVEKLVRSWVRVDFLPTSMTAPVLSCVTSTVAASHITRLMLPAGSATRSPNLPSTVPSSNPGPVWTIT